MSDTPLDEDSMVVKFEEDKESNIVRYIFEFDHKFMTSDAAPAVVNVLNQIQESLMGYYWSQHESE